MEIYKSSNSGDEDEDDIYFPTVQELIAGRGVSGGHAPNAVEKLALDDDDRPTNPNKSMLGPNSGNSQGIGLNRFVVDQLLNNSQTDPSLKEKTNWRILVTFTQTARNPLQVVWRADKLASTLRFHQVPTLKLTAKGPEQLSCIRMMPLLLK
jgi:hypothetical protein